MDQNAMDLEDLLFFKGFEEVAHGIARRKGVPLEKARAILAAGTRRAGAAGRKRNPHLNQMKSFGKAVILGRRYAQPLPMPMLSNGMPNWNAPDLGAYVSLALGGDLKGQVVILHRLPNGMYRIAVDDTGVQHPEDRDKDKSKLNKEEEHTEHMADQDNPVGEEVILQNSLSAFNNQIRKSFPNAKPIAPDYYGSRYSFFFLEPGQSDRGYVTPKGYGPLHPKTAYIHGANRINGFLKGRILHGYEGTNLAKYAAHLMTVDTVLHKAMNGHLPMTPAERLSRAVRRETIDE